MLHWADNSHTVLKHSAQGFLVEIICYVNRGNQFWQLLFQCLTLKMISFVSEERNIPLTTIIDTKCIGSVKIWHFSVRNQFHLVFWHINAKQHFVCKQTQEQRTITNPPVADWVKKSFPSPSCGETGNKQNAWLLELIICPKQKCSTFRVWCSCVMQGQSGRGIDQSGLCTLGILLCPFFPNKWHLAGAKCNLFCILHLLVLLAF